MWPTKFTAWLARNRDRFLLGFGASHTANLAAIIALVALLGRPRIVTLVGGGLVFVLIYALAVVAIARSALRNQPAWVGSPSFESIAMYTIWLVFALAFVARMVKGWPIYSVLGVVALTALVVRVAGRARKAQSAAA